MGLETGTFIDDLVTTNPLGASDEVKQGDDHLRLIKSVLKTTFPNATKAFRFETVLTKTTTYPVVAADARALILADASGGAFTITLPLGSTVFAGYSVIITKSDSSSNAVTVDGNGAETINGTATRSLTLQYQAEKYIWEGTEWKVIAVTSFEVVSDLTPKLGGNLDVNGKLITSVSNGDIVIDPNGSGGITLGAIVKIDNAGGVNADISETGIDRNSGSAETFNIQNSGAGAMTLQVDGGAVAKLAAPAFTGLVTMAGVLEANAKLQVDDAITTPAVVLTSSTGIALPMTGASKKTLTLDHNTTITVSGEVADQVVELWIKQGSTGGTAAWSGVDQWIGGSAPTLSTTTGERDLIVLASESDGTTIIAQHLGVAS